MQRVSILIPTLLASLAAPIAAQSARPRTVTLPAPNATLEHEFTRVAGVRELADGRVLVSDAGEKQLLVVDLKAGSATQLGRNGKGPGEFEQPAGLLATTGDSTILIDILNGRWLQLHGSEIVGTVPPNDPAIAAGARAPAGADTRGNVIFLQSMSANPMLGRTDSIYLVRMARADARADTVAKLLTRKSRITVQGPRDAPTGVSITTNPLASGELATLFPDGSIAVARHGPYRVDWFLPTGAAVKGAPLPFEEVKLGEAELRAFLVRQEARTGRPSRPIDSYADWPETMPAFVGAATTAGADGMLWIQRPATAANVNPPYDVIDRTGALVARVAMGPLVQLAGFGRGVVYTIRTDEDGIQWLERRPLPALR